MAKDVITKIEGNKAWGYIAMGAGLLAVVAIAITVKENLDAKKAAAARAVAEEELESVKEAVGNGEEVIEEQAEESFSGFNQARYSKQGFVSSYRPLRQTWKESSRSVSSGGHGGAVAAKKLCKSIHHGDLVPCGRWDATKEVA